MRFGCTSLGISSIQIHDGRWFITPPVYSIDIKSAVYVGLTVHTGQAHGLVIAAQAFHGDGICPTLSYIQETSNLLKNLLY